MTRPVRKVTGWVTARYVIVTSHRVCHDTASRKVIGVGTGWVTARYVIVTSHRVRHDAASQTGTRGGHRVDDCTCGDVIATSQCEPVMTQVVW